MATSGGPDDTPIVTVSLSLIGVPGTGDCRVMMPCGCELLLSCWTLSVMPFCAAHCWMLCWSWPTKLGSGGPSLTVMTTGVVCGWDSPAAGLVLITIPSSTEDDGTLRTRPGVRPTLRSACSASLSCWPDTSGTLIIRGPADGMRVMADPLRIRPPAAGTVRATVPALALLSGTAVPIRTVKPSARSVLTAAPSVMPATAGTVVYRPG